MERERERGGRKVGRRREDEDAARIENAADVCVWILLVVDDVIAH